MSDNDHNELVSSAIKMHEAQEAAARKIHEQRQAERRERISLRNTELLHHNTPERLGRISSDYGPPLRKSRLPGWLCRLLRLPEQVPTTFKKGDVVIWRQNMCNRTTKGPFVVLETVPRSRAVRQTREIDEDVDPGSPHFMEPLDIRVAFEDPDEGAEVLMYWVDSYRLQHVSPEQRLRLWPS